MNVDRQIHRQGEPSNRPVRIGADSVSRRITPEFIEYKHRATALRRQLSESADVELQVSSFDVFHFADGIRRLYEIA